MPSQLRAMPGGGCVWPASGFACPVWDKTYPVRGYACPTWGNAWLEWDYACPVWGYVCLPEAMGTLSYWNAGAFKNALVEEGLDRGYGVRGGKIKLKMCCARKRQREVSSCDGFIQRNSRNVALSHASGLSPMWSSYYFLKKTRAIMWWYDEYPSFNLKDKNEDECKANFRVEKHHVSRLVDTLDIPAVLKCQQGTVCEKEWSSTTVSKNK